MPASRWNFNQIRQPLIYSVPFPFLVIVPVILAILTIITLFIRSDVNAALLWSQCHSRSILPGLSVIPGFGTPLCYLVSFFQVAVDSLRGAATLAAILAFIGGLLTVSTVEAARVCNAPNVVIAYPTGPWLVFNLVGGAVVWELLIIPVFLYWSKMRLQFGRRPADPESIAEAAAETEDENHDEAAESYEKKDRHLAITETVAIPTSVALGFFVPSVAVLATASPWAIGIWLFFPIYVSAVRQLVRWITKRTHFTTARHVHLESNRWSLIIVYAVPIACSVLAHIFIIWNMTTRDDRKEMARSVVRFIEIDAAFIGLTVLYWMLIEVGWRVPLVMIASAIVVGPGAGICLGWMYRERLIHQGIPQQDELPNNVEQANSAEEPDETTPLMR